MKALWIGLVEVLTPPGESGDTKAFTTVVARADDPNNFRKFVTSVFADYDWHVLGIQDCVPASACTDITSEELLDSLEAARNYPEACIFGTLHYYPSKPM